VAVCLYFRHIVTVKVENDSRFHPDAAATIQRLSDTPLNRWVRIEHLEGPGEDCNRLLDLGLTPGEEVIVTHTAPLRDPLVVRVRGALLALRKREAAWIIVK
jgi:ferrous iron transport protein A